MDIEYKPEFIKGQLVVLKDADYEFEQYIGIDQVLLKLKDEDKYVKVLSQEILSSNTSKKGLTEELNLVSEKGWKKAKERYKIIKPLIDNGPSEKLVQKVVLDSGKSRATIYNWLKAYKKENKLTSLIPHLHYKGKGESRLDLSVETIISEAIEKYYLSSLKYSVRNTFKEVELACYVANLSAPHYNTIRSRIIKLDQQMVEERRFGKRKARSKFKPLKGGLKSSKAPLALVQIDHCLLDVILLNRETGEPMGRPWITLAIDHYSKMVIGYHISMDPPGTNSLALCLSNAILPKDEILKKYNISGRWKCAGIMHIIHVDNAKEFRGNSLSRACEKYCIHLQFRPVKTPDSGGLVERVFRTFGSDIHTIPGTTFNDVKNRDNYNSSKEATLTLPELEEWFINLVVNIYHNSFHETIQNTPSAMWDSYYAEETGGMRLGRGSRFLNEDELKLDFMPYVERSIQRYGIVINRIKYISPALYQWINHADDLTLSAKKKKKFIFRYDPRDISKVYFWDPSLNQYFVIPYSNVDYPPISQWEYRQIVRFLRLQGQSNVDQEAIFQARLKMNEIKKAGVKRKKAKPKNAFKSSEEAVTQTEPKPKNQLSSNVNRFNILDDGKDK